MNVQLFIEGQEADITTEQAAMLTYMVDDVRDFPARHTSFSKTIVAPGTKKNNILFGHIYEIAASNFYDANLPNIGYNYNSAKSATALLLIENIQAFKGVVRLTRIILDKAAPEYELNLFGELGGFIFKMSNNKLEDLDFSAYNQTYSIANITASWDTADAGQGVYFPLIDYGNYSADKHNWDYHTFKPALYLKEYLDKIAAAAGYTYDCALFNTTRFKSLVVPHNMKRLVKSSGRDLDVSESSTTTFTQADGYNTNVPFPFPTQPTLGNFTANGANTQFTYTPTAPLTGKVFLHLVGTFTKDNSGDAFSATIYRNNTSTLLTLASLNVFGIGQTSGTFDFTIEAATTINQNDIIIVAFDYLGSSGNYSVSFTEANLYISTGANSSVPIALGETIPINDSIPKNILQKDVFSSTVKLFNLYVVEDKYTSNKLIIKPYIDFYDTNPASAIDWTYKLDRSKPRILTPMGQLGARYYEFKMKEDNDFYNEQYRKRYNENYGDYIYDSEFEYSKEKETVDIIFSGTPILGYQLEDKVYSTMFKMSNGIEETIDTNIRLLQAKKITGLTSWDIKDGSTTLGSYTSAGWAGHVNDPDIPGNDIQFGVPKELYFVVVSGNLSNTQFNLYRSAYMAEVTDKNSMLLAASFYLTIMDIYNLDFSKFIYLDSQLFRLNKVEDFNATSVDLSKVELLKVINTVY